jgi:hypothetical protein
MQAFESKELLKLAEHPLAEVAIVLAVVIYHPLVLNIGKRIFSLFSKAKLPHPHPLRHFRLLGADLSTISLVAMLKAILDKDSPLSRSMAELHPGTSWMCSAWVAVLYVALIFSPNVFIRFALLDEAPVLPSQRSEAASLFVWRWTLVSWVLGFVNLHVSLKLMG